MSNAEKERSNPHYRHLSPTISFFEKKYDAYNGSISKIGLAYFSFRQVAKGRTCSEITSILGRRVERILERDGGSKASLQSFPASDYRLYLLRFEQK